MNLHIVWRNGREGDNTNENLKKQHSQIKHTHVINSANKYLISLYNNDIQAGIITHNIAKKTHTRAHIRTSKQQQTHHAASCQCELNK